MAVYTTFFLATPDELLDGFPRWKLPLPHPVRRDWRHPFTKQVVSIETREPEWPDEARPIQPPQFRVAQITGRYEDFLEARLPTFVRGRIHWAVKGLTDIEIEPLLKALGTAPKLEFPIYAPPPNTAVLREFPADFIAKLNRADRAVVAKRWATEMSGPDYTHTIGGMNISGGWTTVQGLDVLNRIASLASRAEAEQRMYLLIEV
jgi:hypothetical protein